MKIYIIDSPLMPDLRIKEINLIRYSCGRRKLIEYALSLGSCSYVYTGARNEDHENLIKSQFPTASLEIIPALNNNMRDFSGYCVAIKDAIKKNSFDIILCNSSCSLGGLKSLASYKCASLTKAAIGVGAKSFYRVSGLSGKINPHLQTYALRLIGANSELKLSEFSNAVESIFRKLSPLSQIQYKNILIKECEIGLNDHLKSRSVVRYFLTPLDDLIVVPAWPSIGFPFWDSRKMDPRFTLNLSA